MDCHVVWRCLLFFFHLMSGHAGQGQIVRVFLLTAVVCMVCSLQRDMPPKRRQRHREVERREPDHSLDEWEPKVRVNVECII